MRPAAVLFDLDGVLVDSEHLWDRIRRDVVADNGGAWAEGATEAMMGMSTPEWSRYLVDELGTRLRPEEAAEAVIERMAARYREDLPVLPNAVETVRAVAAEHPVAIASSAPQRIIRAFLEIAELTDCVTHAVSSEQAGAGKPAPDVYLAAARGLGVEARDCAAVEDSSNGLRAAANAGTTVFAIPHHRYPPERDALRLAHRALRDIAEFPGALRELEETGN